MDADSDGDGAMDGSDPEWRVYNAPSGPFLPIILKNSR
jgi:hypothetical protein